MKTKYAKFTGKQTIQVFEKELSTSGDALIKVERCGVCGTDYHMWQEGEEYLDVIPGHEATGTIVQLPANYQGDLKVDDKVIIFPDIPCGACEVCRRGLRNICLPPGSMGTGCSITEPGAYATYMEYPAEYLYRLPETVTFEEGAFVEPASVVLRAVNHADIKVDHKVLISGAGLIGLLAAQLVKLAGADYICITDIEEDKLAYARKMGDVSEAINAGESGIEERLMEKSEGGFDCYIDCSGFGSAINVGIHTLKKGMQCVCIGLNFAKQEIDMFTCVLHEIQIKGSFGETELEFRGIIQLLKEKKLDVKKYISKTIDLDGLQAHFEDLKSNGNPYCKVIVSP